MIDGGTVGDLSITAHRWEARQLRMQASVVAALPAGRRAWGASVPPHFDQRGRASPPNHEMKGRSGEACALRERGPLGRDIATNARVRSDDSVQRPPAVVRRRPGTRHVLDSREWPSVCICVICGHLAWMSVFAMPSCLCVFVFAMWIALCAFSVSLWFNTRRDGR